LWVFIRNGVCGFGYSTVLLDLSLHRCGSELGLDAYGFLRDIFGAWVTVRLLSSEEAHCRSSF
jgi:hypothetical protein